MMSYQGTFVTKNISTNKDYSNSTERHGDWGETRRPGELSAMEEHEESSKGREE